MQVEIDLEVAEAIQRLTTVKLSERDYYFFADWLLRVGVGTVKSALEQHPELKLGDLVMSTFRRDFAH